MSEKKYQCKECGKEQTVSNQEDPTCCGKKMELQPVCTSPVTAENSHLEDEDPPCDDNRAGYRV